MNVALLAGDVIVTVGGVLAVVMVIVRVADAVSPPLSVTAAVSRCVPTESVDTVTLPPLPGTVAVRRPGEGRGQRAILRIARARRQPYRAPRRDVALLAGDVIVTSAACWPW